MSKRRSAVLSPGEALADIIDWIENEGDDEIDEMPLVSDFEEDLSSNESEDACENDDGDDDIVVRPPRKLLTKKRLVHDIDSSMNEENYDDLHFINGEGKWETLTGYLGPRKDKNTKTITWTSNFPLQGRQRACDVLPFGEKCATLFGPANNIDSIEDSFNLLFDAQMFDLLLRETNACIQKKLDTLRATKEHLFQSSKYPYLAENSPLEMRALIGFMYFRGLYGLNHHRMDILFSDKAGPPIFSAIFSKNRAKFLLASLSFIDRENCMQNFPSDRFASVRPMFELFNANCSKYLIPSPYLTIDETLYPMRHQIAFRQYNPNKPHKYGLLSKSLNDASFPFTYKTAPYAGKPTNGDGPYYICSTENYVKYLVNATEHDVSLKGRNISTDRLYTSIPLANWLLDRNITTVGTLNSNRIGFPDEIIDLIYFTMVRQSIWKDMYDVLQVGYSC